MANAEDLNAVQEAPWVGYLRKAGLPTSIGEAGQNVFNAFTWPARVAQSYANNPEAQKSVANMVDYVKNTDPAAANEAAGRVLMPLTYAGKDLSEGKLLDRLRYDTGSGLMGVSDVVAGAINTPGFVSGISGATGGPTLPQPVVDTLTSAGQGVRDWFQPKADWIAGRPVEDSALRGDPGDMSSNWKRVFAQSAAPVPGSVTAPITNRIMSGVNKITGGSKLAEAATVGTGRALEVLSPLSIAPSPGVVGANAAVGAVAAPAAEAYGHAEQVKEEMKRLDTEAKAGETQAVQGAQEAGIVKPSVPFGNVSSNPLTGISDNTADTLAKELRKQNAVKAGFPSTGDTNTDAAIGATLVGGFLLARYRRGIGTAVGDAIDKYAPPVSKKLGGYDPSDPRDATQTNLRVRMAQQRTDATASLPETVHKAMMETGASRTAADAHKELRKEEAARRSGASLSHRVGIWKESGEWLDSTAKSRMPWDEYNLRRNQMSPEDVADLTKYELFKEELHTRGRISGLNATQGRPNAHVRDYGYNFYDTPSPTLAREINRIESTKPHVRDLAEAWWNHVREGTKYAVQRQRVEPIEGQKFTLNHPHYVPPTNLKPGETFFHNRDIVSNWNASAGTSVPRGVRTIEEIGDTHAAKERYIDELFRSTESMATKRSFVQDMDSLKLMGSPTARAMFGRPGPLAGAPERTVTWRDHYGKKKNMEINDTVVRDAFKGLGNPSSLQMVNGAVQQATKFWQSGAVGPMSMANATFFPVTSTVYQAASGMSFTKQPGVALSISDKIAQKLGSKNATGIPGDPTFQAMGLGQGALNMGSVLIDRFSKGLSDSVIKGGWLSQMLSPRAAQAGADMLADWYRRTGLYEMQANGLMGPGMAGNKSMQYNMAPGKSITSGISAGMHKITGMHMPGIVKDASGKLVSGYRFVDDIMHAFSAGPSVVVLKMNRNLPPGEAWKASATARNLSGDPGKSGAFRTARGEGKISSEGHAILTSGFGNPAYQAFGRLFESFRQDPMRLAMGVFTTTVMPGAMSSMWNASQGAEYSQYEFLTRPPERRASHMYIARPGYPPEEGWEWPVEPMLRPFFWAGQGLAATIFGIFGGSIHQPESADMKAAMDEMIMHGQSSSLEKGTTARAVADQSILLPVHPAITIPMAVFGAKPPDSYLDVMEGVKNVIANKNAGFIEGTTADPAKMKLFGHNLPAVTDNVTQAIGATGFQAVIRMLTGIDSDVRGDPQAGVAPKSFMDAVGYQGDQWVQRAKQTTVGQLFGTHRAVTPSQEASAHVVKRKIETLQEITDALTASTEKGHERWYGSRNTGKEEPTGVPPRQPQDQQTAEFAKDAAYVLKKLAPYKEQINLAQKQYGSIKGDNRIPVDEKRIKMENEAYRVIDVNRRMLQDLQRMEAILSVKYRIHVSFDSYDKDKPVSQQNWKPYWAAQMR